MLEDLLTNLAISVVGVLVMGLASMAGFFDEHRLFNPVFWFAGLPMFGIGAIMTIGGLWESIRLLIGV